MTTCLYHGDYGPADSVFSASASPADIRWIRQGARNLGEGQAIQRQQLRGDSIAWCDQGYAWAEQDAVHWLLIVAFVFVIVPYLVLRLTALGQRGHWSRWKTGGSSRDQSPLADF
jgi:hypothetical protein